MKFRRKSILIAVLCAAVLLLVIILGRETITLGSKHVVGMEVGSKVHFPELIQRFGEPVELGTIGAGSKKYSFKNGLSLIVSEDGTVTSISVQNDDSEFYTEREVRPGDPTEKVIQQYGNPHSQHSEQGAQIMTYNDRKNKLSIQFWTVLDLVHTIRLVSNKSN